MDTEITIAADSIAGKKPLKRIGKWHGKTKDLKKEKLVLEYHAEHPDVAYRDIAKAVGVSEVTAYKTLKNHGLMICHGAAQHRRKNRNEKAVMSYYYANPSATVTEISKVVHLAQVTVRKILLTNNITPARATGKKPGKPPEKKTRILEYKAAHHEANYRDIADELQCSRAYVYVILKNENAL